MAEHIKTRSGGNPLLGAMVRTVARGFSPQVRSELRRRRNRLVRATHQLTAQYGPGWLFYGKSGDINSPQIQSSVREYRVLAPGGEIVYTEPRYQEYLAASPLYSDGVYRQKDTFVCMLDDMKFDVSSGVLATKDNILLTNSAMEGHRLRAMDTYGARIVAPSLELDLATSVWHGWAINYYHWMVDCLPRLAAISHIDYEGTVDLVMPDDLKPFQMASLEYCLPERTRLRLVPRNTWVRAKRWIFPSFVTDKACGYLPELYRDYVREHIFAAVGAPGAARRRIYISRQKAQTRRVLNEPEVIAMLAGLGFETFVLEQMSFEEQVRLFGETAVVVAPHGAGLSNMLFGDRMTVFDIFPNAAPETHYFYMARSLGHDYHWQLNDRASVHDDFDIDVAQLERAVGAALSV